MKFLVLVCCVFGCSLVSSFSASPAIKTNLGIIGGENVTEDEFPYTVSLQMCGKLAGCSHFCGGAIIASTWVVTAGHCHDYGKHFQVVAGILDLDETSEYKQIVSVARIIVNIKYAGNSNSNDIALVQLRKPLLYNERVQPISLPAGGFETTGSSVAIGWGQTGGSLFPLRPTRLEYIDFTILTADECNKNLAAVLDGSRNPFNATTNVCTGDDENGRSICNGDSGSPLIQDGVLIGVSSWVVLPCGTKGAPSVFTKVSNYVDWINKKILSRYKLTK